MPAMKLASSPFHYRTPIRDCKLFFGRGYNTKRVLSRLRKGQSVSLVGKRRIGKTSFLYYISSPDMAEMHSKLFETYLFFYIDCDKLTGLSEDDCFRRIKAIVKKTISVWNMGSLVDLEAVTSVDAYYWLDQAFSLLEEKDIRPIIELDDFEGLAANRNLGLIFLGNLRALTSTHETLAYVTTSQRPLAGLVRRYSWIAGSPFPNIFRQYELRPFSRDESWAFLERRLRLVGIGFPEGVLDFLCGLGEGEPYRLQLAGACAYDVWCGNGGSIDERHCVGVKERFYTLLDLEDRNLE